jgi:hypothetical protein
VFTPEILYMMSNISSLGKLLCLNKRCVVYLIWLFDCSVNVEWYLGGLGLFVVETGVLSISWLHQIGVPFKNLTEWHLDLAVIAPIILGDKLVGIQAGNEPDL